MIDTENLRSKLKRVTESEFDDAAVNLSKNLETQLDRLILLHAAIENPEIQGFFAEAKGEVERINDILLNKEGLERDERDLLIKTKSLYTNFVQRFDVTGKLDDIASQIKKSFEDV